MNAKNGQVNTKNGQTDYIRFGRGRRTLVMIPGVGDGLKTVKGMAVPFALLYRRLTGHFTVFVFSRRNDLPEGITTRAMADDLNDAMEALGLTDAVVVGVSQGGMIAQWLAVDHPDKVSRLVLTVTMARPNETVREVLGSWIEMARQGDYQGIMIDDASRSYSAKKRKRALLTYRLMGNLGKPKDFSRFIIQAESCLAHDAWDELEQIKCPTLVIGGSEDGIVTAEASAELAGKIPGSRLKMYEGLSHGLYEEAPDFWDQVIAFTEE